MAEKSSSKQLSINIVASLVSFGVTMGINFFLTPYLVSALGTEAYGFIGLANNFVQYATIITSALNSMSGRFVSIAYHKGDKDKASRLFSSVLVADLLIAGIMLIATAVVTSFADIILNIPTELIVTVKITFGLTFLSYVLSVITAIFTTATYVKNRLDINSIRDIISHLLKALIVILLFTFLPPQLYYVALATLGSSVFLLVANVTVKNKILPDVRIDVKKFEIKLVKALISAGVWMSLAQLSNTLLSGLDLLVCNLTIGATMMGLMSIAKTVPTSITILISTIANVFTPHYTILYAKNDITALVKEVKFTSKILSFILTVPLAGFIIFGVDFYTLWQPSKSSDEIRIIQIISVLACAVYLFTAHTQALTMLNSVCNKMKTPVLVALGVGLVSIATVLLVVNLFDFSDEVNAYIITGISSLLMSLRAIIFIPLYSAHLLNNKKSTFYPTIFRGWITFIVVVGVFALVRNFVTLDSWFMFLVVCISVAVVGYCISIPLLFSKSELAKFKKIILKKCK